MGSDRELWQLGEQFWLGGAEFYERHLDDAALMVLPPPTGVLDRAATIDSIGAAPRWRKVSLDERRCAFPGADTAVLAYRATADRGEPGSAYTAQCGSTYVRRDDRWRLVLHQQTPLDLRGDN